MIGINYTCTRFNESLVKCWS